VKIEESGLLLWYSVANYLVAFEFNTV